MFRALKKTERDKEIFKKRINDFEFQGKDEPWMDCDIKYLGWSPAN